MKLGNVLSASHSFTPNEAIIDEVMTSLWPSSKYTLECFVTELASNFYYQKCCYYFLKFREKLLNEITLCFISPGVKDDIGSKSIDDMKPSTKEEFVELSQLLVGKLSNYEVWVTYLLIVSLTLVYNWNLCHFMTKHCWHLVHFLKEVALFLVGFL